VPPNIQTLKPVAPKRARAARTRNIGFVSLGCPKALVDSEQILTQLRAEGYAISPSYEGADVVVVNTCGFIDAAVEESLDAIGEALHENGKVIVTGCLGAKEGGDFIKRAHPKVLAVTGPHAAHEVMAAIHAELPRQADPFQDLVPAARAPGGIGVKLTPRHYAYLKISEGCNHRCTFCIIPSMRGDLVSRPIGEVLIEAENLLRSGVRELLVISQDTSAYGVDVRYRTGFWRGRPLRTRMTELVEALGVLASEFGAWVRLHYVYPYPHVDEVVPLMSEGAVLPYLDVPFQHASPRILKLMKRPANAENNLERVRGWRAQCPDITLRSTFIVGFPGETEEDFAALLDFLDDAQLDRVGCFAYSPVGGATANTLPDPVPESVREERRALFMQRQAAISARRLQAKIGRSVQVLVDEISADGEAIGRSAADAPEIDGTVSFVAPEGTKPGSFVRVRITSASEHDLQGRIETGNARSEAFG